MEVLDNYYSSLLAMSHNTSSIFIFTIVFVVVYWAMQSHRKPTRHYAPALRALPIVGSRPFLPSVNDLPEFFRLTAVKLKSNVFSIYQGQEYTVVLNGREAITEALVRRSSDYADRAPPYTTINYFNPLLRGIIHSRYTEKFRRHHQITLAILREFGFGQKIMEDRILAEAEDLVTRIKDLKGEPFDPSEHLNICTINVINSIAFGKRLPQSHPTLKKMTMYYHFLINNSKRFIDLCPPLRFLPSYKSVLNDALERHRIQHRFLLESVQETLKSSKVESFVSRFAEREGDKLDPVDLKQIINDLLVAGSETTATSLHWALYFMANNPDVQERVRAEIESVVSRDRFPSLDDLSSLSYVEAAVLEVTRIRPVLPLSLQRCTMRDTQVNGYFVPANTRVIVNLHSVHMDPAEWLEPEVYRPERFLDKEGHVIGKDKVIPFSLGKRSCLGELLARQELFLLFSALVQRFHILPPQGQIKVESKPHLVTSLCPTHFLVRLVSVDNLN